MTKELTEPAELILNDEERRSLSGWIADCVARVLPLFEAAAPGDGRPREAIESVREYALGGRRGVRLRSAAWAALAAAREVDDPAATAAARAAGSAAGTPYIHPYATLNQAKHIVGPVAYQAQARELAEGDPAAGDEEIRWAIEHATPAVRAVLRQTPVRGPGRSRLATLMHQLDAGLRG